MLRSADQQANCLLDAEADPTITFWSTGIKVNTAGGADVDGVSDNALKRKPVVVLGASAGLFGAVWAQTEVKKVLSIGADVLGDLS